MRRASAPLFGIVLLAATGMQACRHHGGFREQYNQMRTAMINGDWQTASQQLEASKEKTYKEEDRVMYWLNLGTAQHYAGNAAASNENLVRAEEAMQELWTTSISSEASKFVVSETVQAYEGEDFEKVLVYLYTALNNVNMNKVQNAVVEARRADELLKKMLVHYEKEGEVGTLYKQDAFMLWLVGLFYEMEGRVSLQDAYLAYKAALASYRQDYAGAYGTAVPRFLGEDLVRTAKMLARHDEAKKFASELNATGETADKLAQGMAELIVIHGAGEAPAKEEFHIDGIMPDAHVVRIALPRFKAVNFAARTTKVKVAGVETIAELAEPVTEMVMKNFEHRLPAIQLRAVARATVKYAATKAAEEAIQGDEKKSSSGRKLAGALVGIAGSLVGAAIEGADLRSWTTLPGAINVARVWVPAGTHQVDIEYCSAAGAPVGRRETRTVTLAAGQRQIISVRSLH